MHLFKNFHLSSLHKLALGIFICLMFPVVAHAQGNDSVQSFPVHYNGEQSFDVGSYHVTINNGQFSKLSITSNGKVVYEKKVKLGRIEDIYDWNVSGQPYLVATYRLEGSGSYLSFNVLKLGDNGQLQKVFSSDSYEHAGVKIKDGNLSIAYPVYQKGDSETTPSALKKDIYQISNGQFTLTNEVKQNLDYGYMHAMGTTSTDCLNSPNNYPAVDCGSNPPTQEISKLLTQYAIKYHIPPEIVKAIAWDESHWEQYWSVADENKPTLACQDNVPGHVVISYDCSYRPDRPGIGIMQVTSYDPSKTDEVNSLKSDIKTNIDTGVHILADKWNYSSSGLIPKVNNNNPDVLENWYFAIMAYNGISQKNDPNKAVKTPYQETIYDIIKNNYQVDVTPFPVDKLQTYYNPGSDFTHFKQSQISTPGPYHLSKEFFGNGDTVITSESGVNFRSAPLIDNNIIDTLGANTTLTITGDPIPSQKNYDHYVWYPAKLSDGTTGYISSFPLDQTVELGGQNRYYTSVDIAKYGWSSGSNTLVIARGDLPPDALSGSVLASKYNAPVLLTLSDQLPSYISTEIDNLKPSTIYVLGGPNAISDQVFNNLKTKSYVQNVIRVSGPTRYDTSLDIAKQIGFGSHQLIIASGNEYSPDALTASSYAGANQIPILLTSKNGLQDNVLQYIKDNASQISNVYIIGGTVPVPDSIITQLTSAGIASNDIQRISGANRFDTSVKVAQAFNFNHGRVFFARGVAQPYTGILYIDALSGAPLAAKYDAPIILTQQNDLSQSVVDWLSDPANSEPRLFYLGGTNAISDSIRTTIQKDIFSLN